MHVLHDSKSFRSERKSAEGPGPCRGWMCNRRERTRTDQEGRLEERRDLVSMSRDWVDSQKPIGEIIRSSRESIDRQVDRRMFMTIVRIDLFSIYKIPIPSKSFPPGSLRSDMFQRIDRS